MLFKTIVQGFLKTEQGASKIDRLLRFSKRLVTGRIVLDPASAAMVKTFLAARATMVYSPDGYTIRSKWQEVLSPGNQDLVFYKIPLHDQFFLYKNALVQIEGSRSDSSVILQYLRGTVSIANLLAEAREFTRPELLASGTKSTVNFHRFAVYEHRGETRSAGFARAVTNSFSKESSNSGDIAPCSPESVSSEVYASDEPLNYSKKDLAVTPRVSCPFDDLSFPEEVLRVLSDIEEWLQRSIWFKDRGLPWKRGILLYGSGGTGKSSFFRSLGQKFGLPIHQIYMAKMTDQEFRTAYNEAINSAPSIVLLEDIDTVFKKRVPVDPKCELSFDTVLNTISGVQNSDGVILGVTTNHIGDIDDALGNSADQQTGMSTRPGRIDRVLFLGAMTDENRLKLITKVLRDWPDLLEDSMHKTQGLNPGQVQEYCIQRALHRLQEEGFSERLHPR